MCVLGWTGNLSRVASCHPPASPSPTLHPSSSTTTAMSEQSASELFSHQDGGKKKQRRSLEEPSAGGEQRACGCLELAVGHHCLRQIFQSEHFASVTCRGVLQRAAVAVADCIFKLDSRLSIRKLACQRPSPPMRVNVLGYASSLQ